MIAQEAQKVLPHAVQEVGNVALGDKGKRKIDYEFVVHCFPFWKGRGSPIKNCITILENTKYCPYNFKYLLQKLRTYWF